MTTAAMICVGHDLKDLYADGFGRRIICIEHPDDNLLVIQAYLIGPESPIYLDNIITVNIQCSENYPFSPPVVTIMSGIMHQNVPPDGQFTPGFLGTNWTPINTIKNILHHVWDVLYQPTQILN